VRRNDVSRTDVNGLLAHLGIIKHVTINLRSTRLRAQTALVTASRGRKRERERKREEGDSFFIRREKKEKKPNVPTCAGDLPDSNAADVASCAHRFLVNLDTMVLSAVPLDLSPRRINERERFARRKE